MALVDANLIKRGQFDEMAGDLGKQIDTTMIHREKPEFSDVNLYRYTYHAEKS